METKVCSKCKIEKNVGEFHIQRSKPSGLKSHCKVCESEYHKIKNREKALLSEITPPETPANKKCFTCGATKSNNEFIKNSYSSDGLQSNCRLCRNAYLKTPKIKTKTRKYVRERKKINPAFKIGKNIRNRLRKFIHGELKYSPIKELGCSLQELIKYLESKFYPHPISGNPMTWDNYTYSGWHIDHIIPLCSFDLLDPEQYKKACHYTNLQPLWAKENLKKGRS